MLAVWRSRTTWDGGVEDCFPAVASELVKDRVEASIAWPAMAEHRTCVCPALELLPAGLRADVFRLKPLLNADRGSVEGAAFLLLGGGNAFYCFGFARTATVTAFVALAVQHHFTDAAALGTLVFIALIADSCRDRAVATAGEVDGFNTDAAVAGMACFSAFVAALEGSVAEFAAGWNRVLTGLAGGI